jgi:hypothetical protein
VSTNLLGSDLGEWTKKEPTFAKTRKWALSGAGSEQPNPPPERCRAPVHRGIMKKSRRTGGDIADRQNHTTNNLTVQELASAGSSAIESFGSELIGPVVRVDIDRHGAKTVTFKLRCGLVAAGGGS